MLHKETRETVRTCSVFTGAFPLTCKTTVTDSKNTVKLMFFIYSWLAQSEVSTPLASPVFSTLFPGACLKNSMYLTKNVYSGCK